MMLDEVRQADVKNGKSFAAFCQQNFGVPYATIQDIRILNKKAKDLFAKQPGTDWQTLVSVARWCKTKKRRIARVHGYVDQYRWAWADGAIEIADSQDPAVEAAIGDILAKETDPVWRSRIMRADGTRAKREVIKQWEQVRSLPN